MVPKDYAERLLATKGQAGGDRRPVTILFSDVKGYALTGLGNALAALDRPLMFRNIGAAILNMTGRWGA